MANSLILINCINAFIYIVCFYLFIMIFFPYQIKRNYIAISLYSFVEIGACFLPSLPSYSTFLPVIIDFIFISSICTESTIKKFIVSLAYDSITLILPLSLSTLHMLIILHYNNDASETTFIDWLSQSTIAYSMILFTILITILLCKKVVRKEYSVAYIFSSAVICIAICIMFFLSPMLLSKDLFNVSHLYIPLIFLVMALSLILYMMTYKNISILDANITMKMEREKIILEQDYYQSIHAALNDMSLIRHDFKHHIGAIQLMADNDDCEKIKKYIENLNISVTNVNKESITCPSALISAIINSKRKPFIEEGGKLNFASSFEKIYIDEYYIVSILSNILDNAIRAAKDSVEKEINLSIMQLQSNLIIECTNTYSEKIKTIDGKITTTKRIQKDLHGYGLSSIKKNTSQLNGSVSIEYTDSIFTIMLKLPNSAK